MDLYENKPSKVLYGGSDIHLPMLRPIFWKTTFKDFCLFLRLLGRILTVWKWHKEFKTGRWESRKVRPTSRPSRADFIEHPLHLLLNAHSHYTFNLRILRPGHLTRSTHYSDSSETGDMLPHYGARSAVTERSFCFVQRIRPCTLNWTASGSGSIQLYLANQSGLYKCQPTLT